MYPFEHHLIDTQLLLKGALVFSNKKLFQSFLQEICAKKLKINCVFSKCFLLIITDGRIRRIQMDKKAFHAILAPPVRKQTV